MNLPLSIWDVGLLLAVTAIVLLVASELIPPLYGRAGLTINKRRLRNIAIVVSMLFLMIVAIRIISIIAGS
jgi:hypothetical protein